MGAEQQVKPAVSQETLIPQRALLSIQPWREMAVLAVLIMDLTWASAWLSFVRTSPGTPSPYLLLGVPLLASYALLRTLQAFRFQLHVQRTLAFALYCLSAAYAIRALVFPETASLPALWDATVESFITPQFLPPPLLVLICYAMIFTRGTSLAARWIGPGVVQGSFRAGSLAWAAALAVHRSGLLPLVPDLFLFLFCMLSASYAVRAAGLSMVRGGKGQRFHHRWLLPLAGFAGATAGFLLLIGSGLSLLAPLVARLATLTAILAVLVFLLLSLPFLWLVYLSANHILQNPAAIEVLREVTQRVATAFQFLFGIFLELLRMVASFAAKIPDLRWIRWLVFAFLLVGPVVYFLWHVRQRRHSTSRHVVVEDDIEKLPLDGRMPSGWRDGLGKGLAGLWSNLLNAFPGRDPGVRIRQIYIELLTMAAALGEARGKSQTPLEFLPSARAAFGSVDEELTLITRAYLSVRYGQKPETNLPVVEGAWQRVRRAGEDLAVAKRLHAERQAEDEADALVSGDVPPEDPLL